MSALLLLFLILSLTLHLFHFSSRRSASCKGKQASPFAFPSLYLPFRPALIVRRTAHTYLLLQQTTPTTFKAGLCPQSLKPLRTRESFRQETQKINREIFSHGAQKRTQEIRTSSRWPNPQELDSTPLRTAQVCTVGDQRVPEPQCAVLAELDAAVLAARS